MRAVLALGKAAPILLCGEGEHKRLGEVASYKVLFIADRFNTS